MLIETLIAAAFAQTSSLSVPVATMVTGLVAVPTTLIAWLHIRLNSISNQQRKEILRLDKRIDEGKESLLLSIESRYVTRATLMAKYEALSEGIRGIHHRMNDFIKRTDREDAVSRAQGERLSAVEAKVEVQSEG